MKLDYLEKERAKVISIRDGLFKDPGGGVYRGKAREFVLKNPQKNLFHIIRDQAIQYFKGHEIVWWSSSKKNPGPTGHLLSSQISCVNHLFFLRNNEDVALRFIQNINPNFTEICCDFDNGFIGFEVVSNGSYLNEGKKQTRGANCTSVDAMMSGILQNGKKIQILIEWKYTEKYNKNNKAYGSSGLTRQERYNDLINADDSPIDCKVNIENLYYEPFYQLMRQTLLADQMVKHKEYELNADDWIHLDIIPEANEKLRYKITSPDVSQDNIEDAWKAQLKDPEKYMVICPEKLLKPFIFDKKYRSLINYLNTRYW